MWKIDYIYPVFSNQLTNEGYEKYYSSIYVCMLGIYSTEL